MELAVLDRRAIKDRVSARLRADKLPLGDVLTLDALVDPCLRLMGGASIERLSNRDLVLRSSDAVTTFFQAFNEAVRLSTGDAFDEELAAVEQRLDCERVTSPLLRGATLDPVDEVDVVIESWLQRIAGNDVATTAHSRAVGAWSSRVAQRMGFSPELVTYIARCGTIHDVGKLKTPHDILVAARRLHDDEWAVMKQHVIDGWKIAVEVPELRSFADAIRGHHERFDGSGYPDGLIHDQISISTRIVSVADSFNAMIADRPYRPPMSPMKAIEELIRHRGTQFDPDSVDAMIDVVLGRM